jgi:proton-translocating NADH-quinone oxidoreductase chain L
MLLVVLGVSSLVHIYSTEYLSADPHQGRFMGYLSLFTGFMLVLVSADNFIVMFLGWEGIGLASFLLIGFWYTRIQAGKSAIKAMLINRVGDLGLALGISAVFLTFKSVDYLVVFALAPKAINESFSFLSFDFDRLTIIAFLLFWGALGKSAQIGLHMWLPDAMEGPTPVSALIHAATLVTAGVFLVIRCSILFENSHVLSIITVFGALTAFFASSVGLVQNDLKRVIAFSTCSQLGYMVFAAGLSHYSIALFHLANHALFKALLFLSAGCIIHGVADEQDMRKMGSLLKLFPTSYVMILIGSLALVGFPFLTGFYSKDAILEVAISKHTPVGNFAHLLGCLAAFCTSFYSFRLVYLTFINDTNTYKKYIDHAHDGPILMVFPLLFLSFGAIFWGFLSRDLVIGVGSPTFGNSIFNNNFNYNLIDSEFLSASLKNIPFVCTLLGILLSTFLINCWLVSKDTIFAAKMSRSYRTFYTFLTQKWHFDQLTNEIAVVKFMNFGYRNTFQLIDKGNIEVFGPAGIAFNLQMLSKNFANYQSGLVSNYALSLMLAVLLALCFFLFVVLGLGASIVSEAFVIVLFGYSVFCFIL